MSMGVLVTLILISKMSWGSTLTCNLVPQAYVDEERNTFLSTAQNAQCVTVTTTQDQLKDYLKEDKTNKRAYDPRYDRVEKWFTCQQFSTQLMLRLGCFHVDSSYQLLEIKTKIRYSDSTLRVLPMFQVSFVGEDKKGKKVAVHAINALFNPNSPEGLIDINNYTFIEPQNDKIYSSIEKVMDDWGIKKIDLQINAPNKINEMEQAECRPQYDPTLMAKFQCVLTDN